VSEYYVGTLLKCMIETSPTKCILALRSLLQSCGHAMHVLNEKIKSSFKEPDLKVLWYGITT
jgi:hypothetical protein